MVVGGSRQQMFSLRVNGQAKLTAGIPPIGEGIDHRLDLLVQGSEHRCPLAPMLLHGHRVRQLLDVLDHTDCCIISYMISGDHAMKNC